MMRFLLTLMLVAISFQAFSQLVEFHKDEPVKAVDISNNFNLIKTNLGVKNTPVLFKNYAPGSLIVKEDLEEDFQVVRDLGINVSSLGYSTSISAAILNQAFIDMLMGVASYDDVPTAQNLAFQTNEDIPYLGLVPFKNAVGPTQLILGNNVEHGLLSFNTITGTFTYSPFVNFNGTDTFSFTVFDGTQTSTAGVVSIVVNPINDAPTISAVTNKAFNEDGNSGNIPFVIADVDNTLSCSGSVSVNSNNLLLIPQSLMSVTGSYPNCVLNIASLANKFGTSLITLTVADGLLNNSTSFTTTVNAVADLPVAQVLSPTAFNEDEESTITLAYTDGDDDLATSCTISTPLNISITQACACTAGVCSVKVKGNSNHFGLASFSYSVTTNAQVSNIALVSLVINPVNDKPIINNASLIANINTVLTGSFTGSDIESSPLTFSVVTQPTKGVISINPSTGAYTFTPTTGALGADTFTVKVSDGSLDSDILTVGIQINNVGTDGIYTINSGEVKTIPAGSTRQFTSVNIAAGGTLNITGVSGAITRIQVMNDFVLNGTIRAIGSQSLTNSSVVFNGETFTQTKTQAAAGASGTPASGRAVGVNGTHGNPLVIFANTISGSGTIDTSGTIGGVGSAATASAVSCPAYYTAYDVCGLKTCGYNSSDIVTGGCTCAPSCANVVFIQPESETMIASIVNEIKDFKINIDGLSLISSAHASSGSSAVVPYVPPTCPASSTACTPQTTPTITGYRANRTGGGPGGNGANVWLRYKVSNANTIIFNANAGAGGPLSTIGSGGAIGNSGSAGTPNSAAY